MLQKDPCIWVLKKPKKEIVCTIYPHAIQDYVETNGFSIVRELCGHGIGKYFTKIRLFRILVKKERE